MLRDSGSEIARIREQIRLEYEASNRVFTDFTPTAAHEFITKRQENIEGCYTELIQYMSPVEAIQLMGQVEQDIYGPFSSVSGNTS